MEGRFHGRISSIERMTKRTNSSCLADCRATLIPCSTDKAEMANLTITVDEDVLRQARIRAIEQGKSVNAILAEYLRSYADRRTAQVDATQTLIGLSRKSTSARGGRRWTRDGRRWTRDELHER